MFDYKRLNLEFAETLGFTSSSSNLDNVESDGLGEWSTLANSNVITFLDSESWGDVSSQVLVSLFVSVVFWNIVQVVSSDDDGSVHLGRDNNTG